MGLDLPDSDDTGDLLETDVLIESDLYWNLVQEECDGAGIGP